MGRRSLTPEPLIQFLISDPVLASVLIWALRRGERFLTYTGHIPQDPVRKSPDGVELACVRPLREEAHWGLIRPPPLWIDKLTTNGRKPFALSLSKGGRKTRLTEGGLPCT